jgi:hypothetical protein
MSCQSEPVEDVAVVLEDLTALNYETRLLRCSLGLGEYPGMPTTYSYPKDPPFFFIERIPCVKGTYCTLPFCDNKIGRNEYRVAVQPNLHDETNKPGKLIEDLPGYRCVGCDF